MHAGRRDICHGGRLDRINRKDRERAEDMRLVENRRNGAALAPEYRR